MRMVEINTVCDTGSTGRIAAGVARIAEDRGHDVYFAYGRGHHPSDIKGYRIGNRIDFILHVLLNFIKGKSGFGSVYVTKRFLRWLDDVQPDILHLHNLHGFYINVGLLFEYIKARNIPVVWTLHDCWTFTGQCAYFDHANCYKWIEGCHACPIFRSDYPYSLFCDNSEENYTKKKELFCSVNNLTIVTPSQWLKELVKESFLKGYDVRVINNGIDIENFRIEDVEKEKNRLKNKYPITDNTLVLGIANVWDKRKGLKEFITLAEVLDRTYSIVLIGLSKSQIKDVRQKYGSKIIGIEHTESIEELVAWYNIADVYVNPTLEDNFPTTNIEALACGTPVVTYATGGSPESIDDSCGMVVDKGDIRGLADAIKEITHADRIEPNKCREKALSHYDMNARFGEYVTLMESVYEQKNGEINKQ